MKSSQTQLKLCVANVGNMSTKGFPKPLCKETGEKDQRRARIRFSCFLQWVKDLSAREHKSFLVARELMLDLSLDPAHSWPILLYLTLVGYINSLSHLLASFLV